MKEYETQGTEEEFLAEYTKQQNKYPPFAFTADIVLLTIRRGKLCALLVQRGTHPEKGKWALPGGFVGIDESAEEAAMRELAEETGVELDTAHIEQLRTYSQPERDPRMRVVSTAFIALIPYADLPILKAGDDAAQAHFFPVYDILDSTEEEDIPLAFDHRMILNEGVERTANKLEYTTLAGTFLEEPFTIADLRRVYEEVWNTKIHAANFRRKILSADNVVEEVPGKGQSVFQGGRMAQLYKRGESSLLMPPIMQRDSGL